jgi:hypothetical protein
MWAEFKKWFYNRIKVPTKQDPRTWYVQKEFTKNPIDIPLGAIVLFSRLRQDLIGWAIRWFTNAEVNHTAIYVGNGFVVEAMPKGVEKNGLTTYMYNNNAMIWIYDFKNATTEQRAKIVEEANKRIGMPYDFADLVGFLLGHHHDTTGQTICSELDVRCVRAANLDCSLKTADATAPGDIQEYAKTHPNMLYLYDTRNVKDKLDG